MAKRNANTVTKYGLSLKGKTKPAMAQPHPTAPGWSLPLVLRPGEGAGPSPGRCCSKPGFVTQHTFLGGYLSSGVLPARGSYNIPG